MLYKIKDTSFDFSTARTTARATASSYRHDSQSDSQSNSQGNSQTDYRQTTSHQQTIASQPHHHPNLPSEGVCHVESGTIFGKGTIPEPSKPHIGKGVALVAQAAAPVYPRVYRRSTISDSTNDHSYFYATVMSPVCTTAVRAMSPA